MKCSYSNRLFVLALLAGVGLSAAVASAQTVVVGAQQRLFEKYGDGSTGPDSVPCCFVTPK